MGEEKSILRGGGVAGILAGVLAIVGLIPLVIVLLTTPSLLTLTRVELLERFPEIATPVSISLSLLVVYTLLLLPFFAALYLSLREPSRVYARIGLGTGILAIILGVLVTQVNLQSLQIFSAVLADSPPAEEANVIASYASVASLVDALDAMFWLFTGFAFAAFGLAMWASPSYSQGLVWLTVILGLLIFLFPLLIPPGGAGLFFVPVLALVLGWKVYSLSRAA